MKSLRASRPRVLLTALAAGTLLLSSACNDSTKPAQDQAAGATSPAATPTATPTPTPTPTGADDPALKSFYGQQIAWAACPADPQAEQAKIDISGLLCGKLHVPLDYTHPAADALDIAMIKLPAAKPDQKVGSLMVNPGGPGASGIEMVKYGAKDFDGALHNRFDVIGFDPRGTGDSSPVVCFDDKQKDARNEADDPLDPAVRKAEHVKNATEHAAACQAKSGKLLPFVGTRNTARDLDVLRAAVGDKKLNYLGVSYGTYLGAVYAEEFPKNAGRLILDGAVDPAQDQLDHGIDQQVGFEKSFERFAADCVQNHAAECPLGKDPAKAAKKAADFLDGLHDHPMTAKDGRKLGRDLAWTGTTQLLYGDEKTTWQYLRNALGWAMVANKADALLAFADEYNGRDAKGHYNAMEEANGAIRCADNAAPAPTPEKAQQAVAKLQAEAPLFSRGVTVDDYSEPGCAYWPFKTPEKAHTIRAEGADPILVVGSTGDPATPYASAEALAKGFAAATLLTRVGEGHGAFGKGNTCIDAALEAYLVDGKLPAAGTRCS
ncbi:alpha/beta hydrolase [Streptomyces sp. CB01881]|uniref:alpha/beta hydrolase n=1 Tax=Streptomyces sp. CB01881 TaxID=2078691 RepID=UPI000CDC817A|nr:alpha/beta hydrolase [Streptomyces sp. CB01881]AUY51415.1 alpha/beta hydrolase [Streptomyces sp. CB01881]TYC74805.1 alpha/beta hydrolase [Streptomyces sp. CB01881]